MCTRHKTYLCYYTLTLKLHTLSSYAVGLAHDHSLSNNLPPNVVNAHSPDPTCFAPMASYRCLREEANKLGERFFALFSKRATF